MAAIGGYWHPAFTSWRVNTVEFHQLGDGFLGDLAPLIPHVCMDTGRAVPLFACLENHTDLIDKQVVFGGTIRSGQRWVAPGVEPASTDAEHTAHQADCVIDSMGSVASEIPSSCDNRRKGKLFGGCIRFNSPLTKSVLDELGEV